MSIILLLSRERLEHYFLTFISVGVVCKLSKSYCMIFIADLHVAGCWCSGACLQRALVGPTAVLYNQKQSPTRELEASRSHINFKHALQIDNSPR